MKKSSALLALAGTLALLGSQASLAETQQSATPTAKPAAKKAAEGTCGEGKCGAVVKKKPAKSDAQGGAAAKQNTSKASKAAEGKCGEGKCGSH